MIIHAMSLDIPCAKDHANIAPFYGILAILDQPSDANPSGSRGHSILLSTETAAEYAPTIIGMGVNISSELDTHSPKDKIGLITGYEIRNHEFLVSGFLYSLDCKLDILRLHQSIEQGKKLGMSFEAHNVKISDQRDPVWEIDEITFNGATILKQENAAFKKSEFVLI